MDAASCQEIIRFPHFLLKKILIPQLIRGIKSDGKTENNISQLNEITNIIFFNTQGYRYGAAKRLRPGEEGSFKLTSDFTDRMIGHDRDVRFFCNEV